MDVKNQQMLRYLFSSHSFFMEEYSKLTRFNNQLSFKFLNFGSISESAKLWTNLLAGVHFYESKCDTNCFNLFNTSFIQLNTKIFFS